jgi:16S rRNA (cytidine1402-2'-O)-methyltransferase
MLFIVATPIGHLGDISERALHVLRTCECILCEDTRRSRILLQHFDIRKPLISFHLFNEKQRQSQILDKLRKGRPIALVSDAGTPLISDPGLDLVRACIAENLPFTAIPGPCSIIHALVLSGFDSSCFQFIGFLPRETKLLKEALHRCLFYNGTSIAFESPQRLVNTLNLLHKMDPARFISVGRELTKVHEECLRGSVQTLQAHFQIHKPRGEIILLIEKGSPPQEEIALEELVPLLQELHGLSLRDAIKMAAKMKGTPKNQVYQAIHRL